MTIVERQFRNSERIALTTCPQKWHWAYEERLKAKVASPALRFGTLIHHALEHYYKRGLKRGPHPRITFEQEFERTTADAFGQGFRDEEGTWHNMGELGVLMLDAYIEQWGEDNRWYVLATEHVFRVPVVDPVTGLLFTFVGVIDLVMRDRASGRRNEVWLWDHKTCKDDPTKKGAALIMDEQSSSYWKYGVMGLRESGLLKSGTNLQGMLFNFLRKGKPDERPKNAAGQALNKDGSVSKVQPSPLFHRELVFRGEYDGEMVHRRTLAQARRMHYMRTGKLDVEKTPGTLHSPHCNWCEFRNMCELHETGGDWETVRDFEFTKWNPYAQHEIENGEKV